MIGGTPLTEDRCELGFDCFAPTYNTYSYCPVYEIYNIVTILLYYLILV